MSERRWVTGREAAGLLGVSRQRVFQLGVAKRLPRKRSGFRWLYAVDAIEERAKLQGRA